MLNLVDESRGQKELTKSAREVSSLLSTPGNPFVPSSRFVSDSALATLDWTEEAKRGVDQNFVLQIITQHLHSAERALQKAPDSPFLMNNLGLSCLNAGKIEEAIGYFENALEIKNDLISAKLNLAKAHLLKGELEAALAIYTDLLPKYPKRALIHESLGEIFLRLALTEKIGDSLAKAEHHLKRAGEGNPSALNNLGIVYMLLGNLRSALSSFKKALVLEPRAAKIQSNIALCYVKLKNYDKGVRHFTASLSLDRQNVGTAKALGRLHLSLRAYQSTVELLREYEKYAKEDTQLLESLGEALFCL
ncbi:tetratricopeptide repeat protein [Nitrospiraceae bacterium AH_259_D15_M11_P09]|nr:tetratricopeptide repeat protein [Nitrospiraceae bacterium AH_259_D15_M11_P09]